MSATTPLRQALDNLYLYSSLSVEECDKIELTVHRILCDELVPIITTLRNYAVADRPSLDALADRLEKLLD